MGSAYTVQIDLLLLAVSDRKRVGFSLILLCKNRFGFRSELAKSKKSNAMVNAQGMIDHVLILNLHL